SRPLAAVVAVVAGASPAWSEELRPTRRPLQKNCSLVSLGCYLQIGVAVGDDLAVLANLHGFTIEHAHAEAVTAEFDCSIGRRNPPFKCRLGGIVVNRYLHVSPFEWFDVNAIRALGITRFVIGLRCRDLFGPHWFGAANF